MTDEPKRITAAEIFERERKWKNAIERAIELGTWAEKHGIPAMSAMVAACKQRDLDVEYKIEGGLHGQPLKELSRMSLLDVMKQALAALPKEKE